MTGYEQFIGTVLLLVCFLKEMKERIINFLTLCGFKNARHHLITNKQDNLLSLK